MRASWAKGMGRICKVRGTGLETARADLTRGRNKPLATSKSVSFVYSASSPSEFRLPAGWSLSVWSSVLPPPAQSRCSEGRC